MNHRLIYLGAEISVNGSDDDKSRRRSSSTINICSKKFNEMVFLMKNTYYADLY